MALLAEDRRAQAGGAHPTRDQAGDGEGHRPCLRRARRSRQPRRREDALGHHRRAASEEFEANGYRGTHVMAIIQKLGINPHIFYRHFPSKLDLLLECFMAATPLPVDATIARRGGRPRLRRNDVARDSPSDDRWHQLGAALQQAIRTEEPLERETVAAARAGRGTPSSSTSRAIFERVEAARPLARIGQRSDLLAYCLIGAHRSRERQGLLGRQVLQRPICCVPTSSCSSPSWPRWAGRWTYSRGSTAYEAPHPGTDRRDGPSTPGAVGDSEVCASDTCRFNRRNGIALNNVDKRTRGLVRWRQCGAGPPARGESLGIVGE